MKSININETTSAHGFKISKSLGQNFLIDENIIQEIIEASDIKKDDLVIEIGPGMGALTRYLAKRCKKIIAVEIDKKIIPILMEKLNIDFQNNEDLVKTNFYNSDLPNKTIEATEEILNIKKFCYESFLDKNIEILNADFLKLAIKNLVEKELKNQSYTGIKIIGNLPYYITTPIIMKILESKIPADNMVFMMQKEVGDRINAKPSTKAYGSLTVATNYYATVDHILIVGKEAFIPRPNVESIVLRFNILKEPPVKVKNEEFFFKVVKAGFTQRRKTLPNSLSCLQEFNKTEIQKALLEADIDLNRRGETLSIKEYATLTDEFEKIILKN